MIKTKYIYTPKETSDGTRILIARKWPRGIRKGHFHECDDIRYQIEKSERRINKLIVSLLYGRAFFSRSVFWHFWARWMKVGVTIKAIHYNSQLKTSLLVYDLWSFQRCASIICLFNQSLCIVCLLFSFYYAWNPSCLWGILVWNSHMCPQGFFLLRFWKSDINMLWPMKMSKISQTIEISLFTHRIIFSLDVW